MNFSPRVMSRGLFSVPSVWAFHYVALLVEEQELRVCGALVFAVCGLIGVIPGPKAQAQ